MARPKAAPIRSHQAQQGSHQAQQGSHQVQQESRVVGYPTLQDVVQSRGLFPGPRGVRDKQAAKVENGRPMPLKVKEESTWQEDRHHNAYGVEQAGQKEDGRLEKKPASLVRGASSSFNMEIDGEDLHVTGSDQDLPSEPEAVHGSSAMPQGIPQNFRKHEDGHAKFACTACGRSVAIVEVRAHPVLHVGVCEKCYDFLFSSPFTKDNPKDPFEHENECRWCGDGGEVILCDTCPKAFCKHCIKRNFGEETLNAIESPTYEWSCFVCDDDSLKTLIRDYKDVEKLVKTMNRSSRRPQKSRISRGSISRIRRSRRPRFRRTVNEAEIASETIATIIARKKEILRRRYPERNFTGFETALQPRRPQQHFLFTQNNTKPIPEHDTSERGPPIPEFQFL